MVYKWKGKGFWFSSLSWFTSGKQRATDSILLHAYTHFRWQNVDSNPYLRISWPLVGRDLSTEVWERLSPGLKVLRREMPVLWLWDMTEFFTADVAEAEVVAAETGAEPGACWLFRTGIVALVPVGVIWTNQEVFTYSRMSFCILFQITVLKVFFLSLFPNTPLSL